MSWLIELIGSHGATLTTWHRCRVLSRLRCLEHDPKSKASVALHAMLAASLLDPERPGDFNQVCADRPAHSAQACGVLIAATQNASLKFVAAPKEIQHPSAAASLL